MNSSVRIPLQTTPEQHARLVALQAAFAQVCNALSPRVQHTRTWNRVALHHLAYRELRDQFPALGSQMVCNAIYSVSRACRIVFQTPGSPFHISQLAGKPLPLLKFTADSPVYFDRHTLSIKAGVVSMYTLDGRMKFQLALRPEDEESFHKRKLREIVLLRRADIFELQFLFGEEPATGKAATEADDDANAHSNAHGKANAHPDANATADAAGVDPSAPSKLSHLPVPTVPEYLQVEEPV